MQKIVFSTHAREQMAERGASEKEVLDISVNYAPNGKVVGIEILDAGKHLFKHKKPQIELENVKPVAHFGTRPHHMRL